MNLRKVKINKKFVLLSTLCLVAVFTLFASPNIHADDLITSIGSMLLSGLCYIVSVIGHACKLLVDSLGGGMDKLVFNVGDTGTMSAPIDMFTGSNGAINLSGLRLTLLAGNDVSNSIYSVYSMIQIIAVCMLFVAGTWIAIDIIKTSNDLRHKIVAKDRLTKLVITILLIVNMPILLDIMLTVNYVITDIFRGLITELPNASKLGIEGAFLMDELAKNIKMTFDDTEAAKTVVFTVMYIGSGLINVWLIIFYMIRDLAISFLFMLFPLIAVFLPFKTDLILTWFKEMFSNIFTQSIQAFVLFITMAISTTILGDGKELIVTNGTEMNLYNAVFCLVSFFMFIPMTAQIKKLFGLEGNIGAAKSNAGLGAAVAAVSLGAMATKGIRNQMGARREYSDQMKGLKAEKGEIEKGISGTSSGGTSSISQSSTPQQVQPRSVAQINGEMRALRRKHISGMTGGLAGLGSGAIMGLAGASLGSPMAAMATAKMGMDMGDELGGIAGRAGYSGAVKGSEGIQDLAFGEGNRPEVKNVFDGVNGAKGMFNGTMPLSEKMKTIKNNLTHNRDVVRNATTGHSSDNAPEYTSFKDGFDTIDENVGFGERIVTQAKMGASNTMEGFREFRDNLKGNRERKRDLTDSEIGLSDDPIKDTELYGQERNARLKSLSLTNEGKFNKARLAYAQGTYNRNDEKLRQQQQIQKIQSAALSGEEHDGVYQYQSADATILYSQNETTGERTILHQGEGHGDVNKKPTVQKANFDGGKQITIPTKQLENMQKMALDKTRQDTQGIKVMERRQVEGTNSFVDVPTDITENSKEFIGQYNKNLQELTQGYVEQIQNLRTETGSSKITLDGNEVPYTRQSFRGTGVNNVAQEGTKILLDKEQPLKVKGGRPVAIAESLNFAHNAVNIDNPNINRTSESYDIANKDTIFDPSMQNQIMKQYLHENMAELDMGIEAMNDMYMDMYSDMSQCT